MFQDLTIIRWATPYTADSAVGRELIRPGANRGQAHNAALHDYMNRNGGEAPDTWFILDDDLIPCMNALGRMQAILDAEPDIWLLGGWNDGCQRTEEGNYLGKPTLIAGEVVQMGGGYAFNIGGAFCAVPRITITSVGGYAQNKPWLEDHDYTQRVVKAGGTAAIARTIHGVVLEDDGVDPTYRETASERFKASFLKEFGKVAYARRFADEATLPE